MRIELIDEVPLTAIEQELLRSRRPIFTRRGVMRFGIVGILGAPLFTAATLETSNAQVLALARYMFAAYSVDGLVKLSQEARAWCTLYNQGRSRQRQALDGQIKDSKGVVEDEASVNISLPPGSKQLYKVTATPEEEGQKTYECSTSDDERAESFQVVAA
jgi:hypothetical protein